MLEAASCIGHRFDLGTGQYEVGYAFGQLALAMAQRFGDKAEMCRTFEVYGVLVHHWKAPLREGLPLLKEGFRAGIESGELAFAAFSLNSVLINSLPAGVSLNELLEEAEVTLDFATTQKNRTSAEIAIPFRQITRALSGSTLASDSFDDETFDETRFLAEAAGHATALGHYWVTRLQLAFLVGDHKHALVCSLEAEKRIVAVTGYGQREDRDRALNAGFDDHLAKPVTPELLDAMFKAQAGQSI